MNENEILQNEIKSLNEKVSDNLIELEKTRRSLEKAKEKMSKIDENRMDSKEHVSIVFILKKNFELFDDIDLNF
jgi:hypothetical protein